MADSEYTDTEEEDYEDLQQKAKPPVDEYEDLGYYFGDITRNEAERKLSEENTPGSFLLRENDDIVKLSWITFSGKMMHARLYHENGKVYTYLLKKFPSVQSLVKYHQGLDPKSSDTVGGLSALGLPKMRHRARPQNSERQSKIY